MADPESIFPTRVPDWSDVHRAADLCRSQLASGVTDSAVTLTVKTGQGAHHLGGQLLTLENERVRVDGISGDDLTVTRAYDGTTAAAHSADVYLVDDMVSRHHMVLASIVMEICTTLGANLQNVLDLMAIPHDSQLITTSSVFTVPDRVYEIWVIMVGGGQSGGSYSNPSSNLSGVAGGVIGFKLVVLPGDTITFSVGAGGARTINSSNPYSAARGGDTKITAFNGVAFESSYLTATGGQNSGSESLTDTYNTIPILQLPSDYKRYPRLGGATGAGATGADCAAQYVGGVYSVRAMAVNGKGGVSGVNGGDATGYGAGGAAAVTNGSYSGAGAPGAVLVFW